MRVQYFRWNQTPEDLYRLAIESPHLRTRERFWALYQIVQGASAAEWAAQIKRKHGTVLGWEHAYNEGGPEAVVFRHTGGRPLFGPTRCAASLRS